MILISETEAGWMGYDFWGFRDFRHLLRKAWHQWIDRLRIAIWAYTFGYPTKSHPIPLQYIYIYINVYICKYMYIYMYIYINP